MAKIPKSIYYAIQADANLTKGSLIYHSAPRKGIMAKIARFVGRLSKIERFRYWGYEVMPTIREDEFKRPLGIALDEKAILISGLYDE